jgi:hypothetical protein
MHEHPAVATFVEHDRDFFHEKVVAIASGYGAGMRESCKCSRSISAAGATLAIREILVRAEVRGSNPGRRTTTGIDPISATRLDRLRTGHGRRTFLPQTTSAIPSAAIRRRLEAVAPCVSPESSRHHELSPGLTRHKTRSSSIIKSEPLSEATNVKSVPVHLSGAGSRIWRRRCPDGRAQTADAAGGQTKWLPSPGQWLRRRSAHH